MELTKTILSGTLPIQIESQRTWDVECWMLGEIGKADMFEAFLIVVPNIGEVVDILWCCATFAICRSRCAHRLLLCGHWRDVIKREGTYWISKQWWDRKRPPLRCCPIYLQCKLLSPHTNEQDQILINMVEEFIRQVHLRGMKAVGRAIPKRRNHVSLG